MNLQKIMSRMIRMNEIKEIKKNCLDKESLELIYLAVNDFQTISIDLKKDSNKYYFDLVKNNLSSVLNKHGLNAVDDFDEQIEEAKEMIQMSKPKNDNKPKSDFCCRCMTITPHDLRCHKGRRRGELYNQCSVCNLKADVKHYPTKEDLIGHKKVDLIHEYDEVVEVTNGVDPNE